MSYVNKICGTTKCTIFTDTIQHYKFMAQQSVRYLQYHTILQMYGTTKCTIFTIQYNTTNVWHNKVYDIYRYNKTLQIYTKKI
jgi:hypothetical protein